MKMEQTECSETSANKIQTPRNHPKESTQQPYILLSYVCRTYEPTRCIISINLFQ